MKHFAEWLKERDPQMAEASRFDTLKAMVPVVGMGTLGGTAGALLGSVGGPWGAAAGAVAGGVLGRKAGEYFVPDDLKVRAMKKKMKRK